MIFFTSFYCLDKMVILLRFIFPYKDFEIPIVTEINYFTSKVYKTKILRHSCFDCWPLNGHWWFLASVTISCTVKFFCLYKAESVNFSIFLNLILSFILIYLGSYNLYFCCIKLYCFCCITATFWIYVWYVFYITATFFRKRIMKKIIKFSYKLITNYFTLRELHVIKRRLINICFSQNVNSLSLFLLSK